MNEENYKELVGSVNNVNNENLNVNNSDVVSVSGESTSMTNVDATNNSTASEVRIEQNNVENSTSMDNSISLVNGNVIEQSVDVAPPSIENVSTSNLDINNPTMIVSNDNSVTTNLENGSIPIVQDVSFPEINENIAEQQESSPSLANTNTTIDNETIIETDVNTTIENNEEKGVGDFEEVSVNVDSQSFNTLSEDEISTESVFNKKEENLPTTSGMKEGVEQNNEKKGFPIFMVVVFVILIIGAFFIDKIVLFANNIFNKEEVVEQPSKKDEDDDTEVDKNDQIDLSKVDLNDLDNQMKKEFSKSPSTNFDVSTVVKKDKYIINCVGKVEQNSDYKLEIELNYKDGVLISSTPVNASEADIFNWYTYMIYVVRSVAKVQGYDEEAIQNAISVMDYVELSFEKNGIDYFSEDNGNFVFKIALNKKIVLPNFEDAPLIESDYERFANQLKANSGVVEFGRGYMFFYYSGTNSTYYFFEKEKSTDNTYKSIINFLKFYYKEDVSGEYSSLKDGTIRDFVIDVDYELNTNENISSIGVSVNELRKEYSLVKLTKK